MMAGIGGAVLFAPFFMLVLRLDPLIALGSGLVIEFFGFSSGVLGYARKKAINFHIVKHLIILTVPATIAGVILGRFVPALVLQAMLAMLLLFLSFEFLRGGKECRPKHPRHTGITTTHKKGDLGIMIRGTSLVGGLLVGMISAGLGEINDYNFLRKLKLPVSASSATSVFLIAMSATVGSISHAYFLVTRGELDVFTRVISLLIFIVPGVIIGAQVGVFLSGMVKAEQMSKLVGVLFAMLGIATWFLVF
jgi:uncharacterized membrane protein YfcA